MPGYYNWKIRNCPQGAVAKAQSLLRTIEELEPYLQKMWQDGDCSFSPEINAVMASAVAKIDAAEDALEAAKLELATLFPGHP